MNLASLIAMLLGVGLGWLIRRVYARWRLHQRIDSSSLSTVNRMIQAVNEELRDMERRR